MVNNISCQMVSAAIAVSGREQCTMLPSSSQLLANDIQVHLKLLDEMPKYHQMLLNFPPAYFVSVFWA